MGINGYIKQLTPALLNELIKNPVLVGKVVRAEPSSADLMLLEMQKLGIPFSYNSDQLTKILEEREQLRAELAAWPIYAQGNIAALHLGPIWVIINYLFIGAIEGGPKPLRYVIYGKTPIGKVGDFVYEKPNYLTPKEVQQIYQKITEITDEKIKERYYSSNETNSDFYLDEDGFEEHINLVNSVRDYYRDAANCGNAMLSYFK